MPTTKPDPLVITRTIVKRAWSDIEPKIAVGLASGTGSVVVLEILAALSIHLPVRVTNLIPVCCTILAGYLTPSVGTTSTIRGDDFVVEKHSGNVEIKTGAIPIQRPAAIVQPTIDVEPFQSRDAIIPPTTTVVEDAPYKNTTQSFTEVISADRSRADAFISRLPSQGGNSAAVHEDEPEDDGSRYTGNNWGN